MAERTGVEQATVGALPDDIGKLWAQASDRDPAAAHGEGCTRSGAFRGYLTSPGSRRPRRAGWAGQLDLAALAGVIRHEVSHLVRLHYERRSQSPGADTQLPPF